MSDNEETERNIAFISGPATTLANVESWLQMKRKPTLSFFDFLSPQSLKRIIMRSATIGSHGKKPFGTSWRGKTCGKSSPSKGSKRRPMGLPRRNSISNGCIESVIHPPYSLPMVITLVKVSSICDKVCVCAVNRELAVRLANRPRAFQTTSSSEKTSSPGRK